MAKPGRRLDVDVERLQITLAKTDVVLLDRVVRIGKFGRNRNDVAARIVSDWLHDQSPAAIESFFKLLDSGEQFDRRLASSEGTK